MRETVRPFVTAYLSRLHREDEERVHTFLNYRLEDEFRCFKNIIQITAGEKWTEHRDGLQFLRMLRLGGGKLPAHLDVGYSKSTPIDCTPEEARGAVWQNLVAYVEAGDAGFFKQVASLLAKSTTREDFPGFIERVRGLIKSGGKLYRQTDSAPRGRHYLQRLILAIFEILIDETNTLPSLSQVRKTVAALMEKPPIKRDFDLALKSVGLAPPVLV